MNTCDRCRRRFDAAEWHPAALGDDGAIFEFCSPSWKARFLAESERQTGSDGATADAL